MRKYWGLQSLCSFAKPSRLISRFLVCDVALYYIVILFTNDRTIISKMVISKFWLLHHKQYLEGISSCNTHLRPQWLWHRKGGWRSRDWFPRGSAPNFPPAHIPSLPPPPPPPSIPLCRAAQTAVWWNTFVFLNSCLAIAARSPRPVGVMWPKSNWVNERIYVQVWDLTGGAVLVCSCY